MINYAASPLPAEAVFKTHVSVRDPNTLTIHWDIKEGYFIYKKRIKLNIPDSESAKLGSIVYPKTAKFTDSQGKAWSVYSQNLTINVPILGEKAGDTLLKLRFQGCAADGFCYPPETRNIMLSIDKDRSLSTAKLENNNDALDDLPVEKEDAMASVFDHHWLITTLLFYGFGLLLTFTPCVLPMIPVLSGIIVGHGPQITLRKAFILSASYVLSMSITYAIAGAMVALLGSNLQIMFQTPIAIGIFSLAFVLLSLSMFGFYELRLPESLQNRLSVFIRSGSGHYLGAALMGCLSTLILSPCVTAPLIGVLGYIASTGDIFLGTVTLFFMGLGMGTPLLIIGTSAGRWLPHAGPWMNVVKSIFGVLLLAVAIYLAGRILPPALTMALWAALFVFSGIYAGALKISQSSGEKFSQGMGIMLLLYGLLILIGASMGESNPLQPLAIFQKKNTSEISRDVQIHSLQEFNGALNQAKGRPVFVDFHADWCTSCKIMEATTFQESSVREALKQFVVLKVDLTKNTPERKALMEHFKVVAPPTFLIFNAKGKPMPEFTMVGEVSTKELLMRLEKVVGGTS